MARPARVYRGPMMSASAPTSASSVVSSASARPGAAASTPDGTGPRARHAPSIPPKRRRRVRGLGPAQYGPLRSAALRPAARQRPERGERGPDARVGPALEARWLAGLGQRGVPRVVAVGEQVADDGRARPARALGLPPPGPRTRRGPVPVGRRRAVRGAPGADGLEDLRPRPRPGDGRLVARAARAALGAGLDHRPAAPRARARAQVVAGRRGRDAEVRGDLGDRRAASGETPRRRDPLGERVGERQPPYGQAGRLERAAPGAEVPAHARSARPPRVLAHPLALGRPGALGLRARPLLRPRRRAGLGRPGAQRRADRVRVPAPATARVAHRRVPAPGRDRLGLGRHRPETIVKS